MYIIVSLPRITFFNENDGEFIRYSTGTSNSKVQPITERPYIMRWKIWSRLPTSMRLKSTIYSLERLLKAHILFPI